MRKINKKYFPYFIALFILFVSIFTAYASLFAKKLEVDVAGKFGFELPINATHLKVNGNFQILNLKFSGDFDLNLLSQKPLKLKIFSNSLKVDLMQLFIMLQKLGYLKTIPKGLKGPLVLKGVYISVNNNTYNLKFQKAYGPLFKENKIILKKFKIQAKIENKEAILNLSNLTWGKTQINNLIVQYSPKIIRVSSNNVDLDLKVATKTIFSFSKELKTKLFTTLNKFLDVNDIILKGNLIATNLNIFLLYNKDKKTYVLKKLSTKLSSPNTVVELLSKHNRIRPRGKFIANSLSINYDDHGLYIDSKTIDLNLKDLYYKKEIKEIGWHNIYLSQLSLKTKFNYNQQNSTLSLNAKFFDIKNIELKDKSNFNSKIILNLDPINISLKNNILSVNSKELSISPLNINYIISNNTIIKYSGKNNFKNIVVQLNLDNKSTDIKTDYTMLNSNILYKDIDSKIIKLNTSIDIDKNILNLNSGFLDAEINNKGKILGHFNSKIPLVKSKNIIKQIYKDLLFDISAKHICYQNLDLNKIKIKKANNTKTRVEYNTKINNIDIVGNTELDLLDKRLNIITRELNIKEEKQNKKIEQHKQQKKVVYLKFNLPSIVWDISKYYHFEFDHISYQKKDMDFDISSLKGDFFLKDHPILGFGCYFCNLYISGEMDLLKQGLSTSLDIKAISLPIDHLIGCFMHRAPVYITGDTNIQLNIMSQGATLSEFKKNLKFDGLFIIDNGRVLKLSNLGKKVELILDILHFVKLNPSKLEDSLEFNKLIASLSGGINFIKLKEIKMASPVLNLYCLGSINLEKKLIKISGKAEKGWLSKEFNLEKKFNKKE